MSTFKSRHIANSDGFTLIEALLAATLMAIAVLTISLMLGQALSFHSQDKTTTASTGILQKVGDRILSLPVTSPPLESGITHKEYYDLKGRKVPSESEGRFQASWTVTEDTPIEGVRRIDLRVETINSGKEMAWTAELIR